MAAGTLKLTAREELIRLYNAHNNPKFTQINSKQQSIAAARFYIDQIHNPVKSSISDDDLDEGIVDGSNDLGCDFIHRDDGHVIVIQAKFRNRTSSESPDTVTYFKSLLKRFRDPDLKPNRNLLSAIRDIDWDRDSFELVFLTFSKMPSGSQARVLTDQIPDYPTDLPDIRQRCEWRFFDEEDLNVQLRNARSTQRGVSGKKIALYPGLKAKQRSQSVIETLAGDYRSFIMTLDARQIQRMYEELDRDALFSLNIRNYIGNTKPNKDIIESAINEPDKLFIYNNGISCLAIEVTITN
jgi:AIPR protein